MTSPRSGQSINRRPIRHEIIRTLALAVAVMLLGASLAAAISPPTKATLSEMPPADFQKQSNFESDMMAAGGPPPYCGIIALYRAMQPLGIEAKFADLVDPNYVTSRDGSSVTDLIAACKHFQLFVEPVDHMTLKTLLNVDCPTILHVKTSFDAKSYNHWILFLGMEKDLARICDGTKPLNLISLGDLAARWDGLGLVISRKPIDLAWLRLVAISDPLFYVVA